MQWPSGLLLHAFVVGKRNASAASDMNIGISASNCARSLICCVSYRFLRDLDYTDIFHTEKANVGLAA